jgi:hypothetical protein
MYGVTDLQRWMANRPVTEVASSFRGLGVTPTLPGTSVSPLVDTSMQEQVAAPQDEPVNSPFYQPTRTSASMVLDRMAARAEGRVPTLVEGQYTNLPAAPSAAASLFTVKNLALAGLAGAVIYYLATRKG